MVRCPGLHIENHRYAHFARAYSEPKGGAMPTTNLTDIAVRQLKPPASGQITYYDDNLKGFGIRLSPGGTRTWVLVYGPKRKRVKLGTYPHLSLAKAREKAKDVLSEYQLNGEKPKNLTWGEAKDLYEKLHIEKNNRPVTQRDTKRLLRRFDTLRDTNLADLATGDVLAIVDKLADRPGSANHHYVAVKGFLNWCVGRQYLPYNPLSGTKKPARVNSRSRVLSDEELKNVLATARTSGKYGEIVLWCLYTLQRRGQIAHIEAGFFNFTAETIKWPAALMKGNRDHELPYTALQSNVPDKGLLFPNAEGNPWNAWSKPHRDLLKASRTTGWTLHDLRRTGATRLAEMGHAPHVIERILAHSSGTLTPLALIYNRATYLTEMREALKAWQVYLDKLH